MIFVYECRHSWCIILYPGTAHAVGTFANSWGPDFIECYEANVMWISDMYIYIYIICT